MNVDKIIFEKKDGDFGTVYGVVKSCGKFEIFKDIPSNSFLWFFKSRLDRVNIEIELDDVEKLKFTNIKLSSFLSAWVEFFGGLELE